MTTPDILSPMVLCGKLGRAAPGAIHRVDRRSRARERSCAWTVCATGIARSRPATTVAALVDPPTRLLRSAFPAGVERRPRSHRVHPVQRQIHVAAGLQVFFEQNGTMDVMVVAVLLLDPPILVFATGPPTTQPVEPLPRGAGRCR